MGENDRIVRRVTVAGRVQGVWFRGWTVENAQSRGLHGWVRNRKDGSVEACFAGPSKLVDDMVEACRKGPPMARVDAIVTEPAVDEAWTGFSQLPTAE
ncbi:MAG: acylphosphatase [Proteobacteria bacterium]|nr:acylphosphatase [Pseudomonadota bacterium]